MILIINQNIRTKHHIVTDFNMVVGSNNTAITHSKVFANFQFSAFANADLCAIMHFQLSRNVQFGFSIYGDFSHRRHNCRKGSMESSPILNLQNGILDSCKRNTKYSLDVFIHRYPPTLESLPNTLSQRFFGRIPVPFLHDRPDPWLSAALASSA